MCVVATVTGWFGVTDRAVVSLHASLMYLGWDGMGWDGSVLPCCGSAPAVVLGLSLGQHLAHQEQKLLQDAQSSAVSAAAPVTSHGKGEGFSLPRRSARGSLGRNWSFLLLWICRHAGAP